MPGCAAYGCSNRTEHGYALKVFPRDPERRALWTAMINRKNWTPTNTSYICEKHFADNQWEVARVDGKKKLKANAVPTIFEMSRKRNSNVKKKRGRKCKQFEKSDEDDYVDENLQTNTQIVMERLECFVCCCPLVSGHKVNLSSLTTTSGVTMLQCITGISNSEAEKLQRHRNDGMESLCNRCARLINYVDKMEAELALLKSAISGCLQVKSLNGDCEQLGADLTSHVLVLDEFESNLSGSNFVEKSNSLEQDHLSPDVQKSWNDTEKSSEPKNLNEKDGFVPTNVLPNGVGKEVEEEMKNAVDERVYQCQICRIKTTSRSVLFFHLRKHMATNQWCDFCDIPFNPQGDEAANMGDMLSEVVSEVCDAIS